MNRLHFLISAVEIFTLGSDGDEKNSNDQSYHQFIIDESR